METKIVVLASILCTILLVQHLSAEPIEDQLPDTTGKSQHFFIPYLIVDTLFDYYLMNVV